MKLENIELNENEKIDDLQFKGLKIIQNKKFFCFGIDAVLLSDFSKSMKNNSTIVDFCTGTGIIPILLSGKSDVKEIIGVEINKQVADMAKRSVYLNNLQDKIKIINDDLNNIRKYIKIDSVDYIVVNPPYKAKNSGIINDKDELTEARHEVSCTLEDIIRESSKILKNGGGFYMIHKPERLADVFCFMRKYKIEPKYVRFVHSRINEPPNLVLIEGVKDAKPFLKIQKPLYIYNENKEYTDEIKEIYNIT